MNKGIDNGTNQAIKVNRTTITLYRAMFELLAKSAFDEITVNDICQHAMVSRTTFYSYFQDKYELVIFCLRQERSHLGVIAGENVRDNILTLLHRFKEQSDVYQNLLLAQTNRELNQMIITHMHGFIESGFSKVIALPEELDVLSVLYASGYAGTIMWWLENGMLIAPETLADYLYYAMEAMLESVSGEQPE